HGGPGAPRPTENPHEAAGPFRERRGRPGGRRPAGGCDAAVPGGGGVVHQDSDALRERLWSRDPDPPSLAAYSSSRTGPPV
ncbi:unnamed protein product, partial [Prorocentrum cordatum]